MKKITIIARIIMGSIFTLFSLMYFLHMMPAQELQGPAGTFMTGLFSSGYMLNIVKAVELICGIALITGQFSALANYIFVSCLLNARHCSNVSSIAFAQFVSCLLIQRKIYADFGPKIIPFFFVLINKPLAAKATRGYLFSYEKDVYLMVYAISVIAIAPTGPCPLISVNITISPFLRVFILSLIA
jgi:uncharacterized membrane protein YphA (DoxX/SURF4 family)